MKKVFCELNAQDIVLGRLPDDTAPPPAWYQFAKQKLGTKEFPGTKNNPTILGWATSLGAMVVGMVYNADSIPWCGLFIAKCVAEALLKPPKIPVRAKVWSDWGIAIDEDVLMLGTILVFDRAGGGHVGLYAGETDDAYFVLGGNQSDSVNYTWIAKERCIARRWPKDAPFDGRRPIYLVKDNKQTLSTNET